jgi:hypothetical protein
MPCRADQIINPYTLECISKTGRVARALLASGDIADYDLAPAPMQRRPNNATRRAVRSCLPHQTRNPMTGRCIKIGGATHKKARVYGVPENRSEERLDFPLGLAFPAPLDDPRSWRQVNCRNTRDPIKGLPISAYPDTLLRLHNGTCAIAEPLHSRVAAEHGAGRAATLPDGTILTREDFKALRNTMRRLNPAYTIPAIRKSTAKEWTLLLERSDEYILGTIINRRVPVAYIGYIPIHTQGRCSIHTVIDMLRSIEAKGRLITLHNGAWKPVVGPFTRQYWTTGVAEKFNRMCGALRSALISVP